LSSMCVLQFVYHMAKLRASLVQIALAIIIYLTTQYKKDRKALYMLVISAFWCLVAEITANMTFFYCLSQRDSLTGAAC
jgi:hypothetical protein